MASRPFSHLHNHSEYSPLDGMQHISDMFERAARFGQPGVGITDHGRLGGMVEAAKASEKTWRLTLSRLSPRSQKSTT